MALPAQAAACWHRPQGVLAKGPALGRLIRLMCSPSADPATVAACVGALNNVCAMEEASDCVCEEARHATPQASAPAPPYIQQCLAASRAHNLEDTSVCRAEMLSHCGLWQRLWQDSNTFLPPFEWEL